MFEKSPKESKKYRAYIIGDVSWSALILIGIVGLYGVLHHEGLDAEHVVDVALGVVRLLIAMVVSKLIMSGTYIGGQAWVDKAVRVAIVAAGGKPETDERSE